MKAFRWPVAALAALAGAGALFYIPNKPDESPPLQPPQVAALPLALPAAAPSSVAADIPKILPAANATVPAAASPPRIGSEGYGPHIERAQADGTAAEAWVAVQWLRLCASNELRRDSYEKARAQGAVPEVMTELMREADDEARRCQTVTAQHHAMLPDLAARAMRANIPGAATAYAAAVSPGDLTADQRSEVANAMRRDAQAGSPSLLEAALSNPAWGLTDEERLGFIHAFGELFNGDRGGKAMLEALVQQGAVPLTATPSPSQIAAAKVVGQQIVDRVRPDIKP